MHLASISFVNFRCYEDAEFRFQPGLTLITGGNDAGKSALLDGIQALLGGRALDENDLRHVDGEGLPPEEISISGVIESASGPVSYRRVWRRVGDGVGGGALERKTMIPSDPEIREALDGWGRAPWVQAKQRELLRKHGAPADGKAPELRESFDALCEGVPGTWEWVVVEGRAGTGFGVEYHAHDQANDDPVKEVEKHLKAELGEAFAGETARTSFSSMRRRLSTAAKRGLSHIAGVFAKYDGQSGVGDTLRPVVDVDISRGFSLTDVEFKQGGGYRRMSRMGAAKRRKLQLALLQWRREIGKKQGPRVLLYDEPDTHFDYQGQRQMSKLLGELSKQDGLQVVVATHSLNLIDRVDLYRIAYLNQVFEAGTPTTSVVQPTEWGEVAEVARELGLRNHVVLNACLLMMEGPTEHALLPGLFELVRGYALGAAGIEVLRDAQGGNSYAWDLSKHALRHRRRTFLVLDRDTSQNGTITRQAIRGFNQTLGRKAIEEDVNLFYLGTVELEDLFPKVVLVEALHRHAKEAFEATGAKVPSRAALGRAVSSALALVNGPRPKAYTKQLEKALRTELGTDAPFKPDKPRMGEILLEVYRETERRPPKQIVDVFDQLERFAES